MYKLISNNFVKIFLFCFIVAGIISCDQGSLSLPDPLTKTIVDVTDSAKLTVSKENYYGRLSDEGSIHLIDGKEKNKFLLFYYHPDFWAQQAFDHSVKINAYTITSANDAPGRDPEDWKLKGSNDGSNWKLIDVQKDQSYKFRKQTKIYHLDSSVTYKYYRLYITSKASGGTGLMQLSEWRLLYYQNR